MSKKLTIIYRIFHIIIAAMAICVTAGAQSSVSITLEDCLQLAESNDPYLKNARLDIESARARKSEAMWEYFPSISLNALGYHAVHPLVKITPHDVLGDSDAAWELNNAITDMANEYGVNSYYSGFRNGFSVSAFATQPVYAGGRIVSGNRLASLGVRVAGIQSDIRSRDTHEEVCRKFNQVLALQEKLLTVNSAMSFLETLHHQVSSAVDAGIAVESDLRQVKVKRQELSDASLTLRSGLKLAKMNLFNSIGMQYTYYGLDSMVFDASGFDSAFCPEMIQRGGGVAREAELLQAQVEARRLEKKMAVGEHLPQVGVGASYGWNGLQNVRDGRMNGLGFVSVQIPLTGIGKAVARARRYDNEIQKAVNEKEYLDAQLRLQEDQMWLEVETAYNKMGIARELRDMAAEDLRRAEAEYKAGRCTASELAKAELDSVQAAEDFTDRVIDYRNASLAYSLRFPGTLPGILPGVVPSGVN